MFIHTVQTVLSPPGEVDRVQNFPDWFVLPRPRTHSFRYRYDSR
jgi:hypothetical protein